MKIFKYILELFAFISLIYIFMLFLGCWQRKTAMKVYQEMRKGAYQTERIIRQKNKSRLLKI